MGGAKLFRACGKSKLQRVGASRVYRPQEEQPRSQHALIDLTYLAVLFNFNSLYRSSVQTASGVAQWENQPTVRATLDGSRRTVSVRGWKRSGDAQHSLVAGKRDVSN